MGKIMYEIEDYHRKIELINKIIKKLMNKAKVKKLKIYYLILQKRTEMINRAIYFTL